MTELTPIERLLCALMKTVLSLMCIISFNLLNSLSILQMRKHVEMFFNVPNITQLRKLQSLDLNSHLTDSKTRVLNLRCYILDYVKIQAQY